MKTWLVMNDVQIPFQDKRAVELVLRFMGDLRPDGVVLNGDIVDCYSISSYSKDPLTTATLNKEIAGAEWLMASLKHVKEKWWLGGNHEDRLRRYIWDHAPKFDGLKLASFPELFSLPEYGFQWRPYGQGMYLGKLLVTHGSTVRSHSGMSGKAHYDKYGTSVMIGHTHRLGIYYHRNVRGVHAAYENGCLCKLDPEYDQHPNWQQGISVVHVESNGFFNVQQIPILNGRTLFYGGQRYGA